jgi:uncharacterized protein YecE (DUF72 family)
MKILIGTSGFSYDDWRGYFYPADLKREEMLSFYARYFPVVEINATYYRLPTPTTMLQMARKVPEGFRFVVKANQEMTHADRFQPEAFAQFREALEPLREAGMLGCVLAQFPWSFRRTPENERFLGIVRRELPGTPVVVEFRNAEWVAEETFARLRGEGLGFCAVDEPPLKGLVPPVVEATSPIGYVRFHGRNREKWWRHEHAYERYDYLYSEEELREWTPRIAQLAAETEETYVFFNNHYIGKAGQNARQMADLLNQPHPWPEEEQGTLEFGAEGQEQRAEG